MPFVAGCPFCCKKMRVPDHAVGMSIPCPRCACSFTVVPLEGAAGEVSLPVVPTHAVHSPLPAARAMPEFAANNISAKRILSPLGVVSISLASVALVLLSLPALRPVTLTLGGLALAAGLLGLALGGETHRGRVFFPAAGAVLAIPVLLVAGLWPNLLSPTPPADYTAPPPEYAGPLAVPHSGKGAQPALDWVDASTHSAQVGDLRVRVLRVSLGPVDFTKRERVPGMVEWLQISFRVYNAGTTRRLDYRGWGQSAAVGEQAAVLRDDRGQIYRLHAFDPGAGEVVGQVRTASIAPLRPVDDVLVFDPPTGPVEFLLLELPASAAGEAGTLRLRLPHSLFHGL